MTRRRLFGCLLLAAPAAIAGNKRERDAAARMKRQSRELRDRLHALRQRPAAAPHQQSLYPYAEQLLNEANAAPEGSYLKGRLLKAADGLLDAAYELDQMGRRAKDKDDSRERTARDLTDSYFRVKQGDYYASQARHTWAPSLVPIAQQFYQLARKEYDRGANSRARRLAEAAREVISSLESLAQAAVRVPEPPKM